jgi:ribonuclease BN (tRNA processing enzyme)
MQRLSLFAMALLVGFSGPLPTEHLWAQNNNAPAPRTSTRLITLGTRAGPPPTAHRAQSSNLLIVNGTDYVIDAGDGVVRRVAKAGVRLQDIGTIFITHHHDDHTAGLGPLMSVAWDQNRTQPINVYAPPGTESLVKAAIQYFTLSSEIRIADGGRSVPIARVFFGHDVAPGVVYEDANIKVTAVENTHFTFHTGQNAGRFKSYSYRFETPDRVVVFTGDTGPSEAVLKLAKGADVLVAEVNSIEDRKLGMIADGRWAVMSETERARIMEQAARGHLSPEDVGQLANHAQVKTVVLTHLTFRPPPNTENYQPWADEVKKYFSGQVLVAKDLMEF